MDDYKSLFLSLMRSIIEIFPSPFMSAAFALSPESVTFPMRCCMSLTTSATVTAPLPSASPATISVAGGCVTEGFSVVVSVVSAGIGSVTVVTVVTAGSCVEPVLKRLRKKL